MAKLAYLTVSRLTASQAPARAHGGHLYLLVYLGRIRDRFWRIGDTVTLIA
jgi:hypothetical protein